MFSTLANASPNPPSRKSVRSLSRCVCALHENSDWPGSPLLSLTYSKATTRPNGSSDLPANKRPRYVSTTMVTPRFDILSYHWQSILRWLRLCSYGNIQYNPACRERTLNIDTNTFPEAGYTSTANSCLHVVNDSSSRDQITSTTVRGKRSRRDWCWRAIARCRPSHLSILVFACFSCGVLITESASIIARLRTNMPATSLFLRALVTLGALWVIHRHLISQETIVA